MAGAPKPPRSIKIGPLKVAVEVSNQLGRIGEDNGQYLEDEGTILVRGDIQLNHQRYVLWHEIKHAVWMQVCLHATLDAVKPEDREEHVIGSSAALEFQVLAENASLRRYLFG